MKHPSHMMQKLLQVSPASHCSFSAASSHAEAFSGCHSVVSLDAVIAASIFVILLSILLGVVPVQVALIGLILVAVGLVRQKNMRTKEVADQG